MGCVFGLAYRRDGNGDRLLGRIFRIIGVELHGTLSLFILFAEEAELVAVGNGKVQALGSFPYHSQYISSMDAAALA